MGNVRNPPSDDDIVVRGTSATGMKIGQLLAKAEETYNRIGFYGLSVQSIPGTDAHEIARIANLPHQYLQHTTVCKLREIGIEFKDIGTDGHWTVKFDSEGYEQQVGQFIAAFEPPERK